MKIAIIANGYPDKKEPQWGCFERDQALALSKMGHKVSILYVDGRFRKNWKNIGITCYNDNGLSIYGIFLIPLMGIGKISNKLHYRVVSKLLNQVYCVYTDKEGEPDVIYAHYLWNIAFASLLKKNYHKPLIGIEHWSGMTKETLSQSERNIASIAYSNCDKLLVVSKSLQAHIYRHFGKESSVVYDMLGQEFINTKFFSRDEHFFRFIAVGSLISRKGFDLLLGAFKKSKLAEKGCKVIIIGDGPERERLQKQSELLCISETVEMVGRKTKKEIIRLLQECHAFVLSSRAETFGVVCIEALSQGLPNIATICGGPEEFINENNGILIPPEDINALSDAMIRMYNNFQIYDSKAIADDCKQRFSPQVIAKQLADIFEKVTNT